MIRFKLSNNLSLPIMGIRNFKTFLNISGYKYDKLEEFDSILIDIQSYLYKGLQSTLKSTESGIIEDVCCYVIKTLNELFENIFSYDCFTDTVKIIISFDGESIPMKLPTQKQRRNVEAEGKNVYKLVLFGHNTISERVRKFIVNILNNNSKLMFPDYMKTASELEFHIIGSDTKGEGEHKLFRLGSYYECRKPVIDSIDNDVFIIALSQLYKFDSIQIYKSKYDFLNINRVVSQFFSYDKKYCILASLLFGNDFIPAIINLTDKNCPLIHEALKECNSYEMPMIFYTVLKKLKEASKIRFKVIPQIEELIIIEFWKNCFWVLDYYEKYKFPQKYMENYLFDIFDKDHIVSALLDIDYSQECYKRAYSMYKKINLESINFNPIESVFTNEQLKKYEPFFIETDQTSKNEKYNKIVIKRAFLN